jgi:hypothetical protein
MAQWEERFATLADFTRPQIDVLKQIPVNIKQRGDIFDFEGIGL